MANKLCFNLLMVMKAMPRNPFNLNYVSYSYSYSNSNSYNNNNIEIVYFIVFLGHFLTKICSFPSFFSQNGQRKKIQVGLSQQSEDLIQNPPDPFEISIRRNFNLINFDPPISIQTKLYRKIISKNF